MSQVHEVRYWAGKVGVTRDELREPVDKAGPMAEDVERRLKRKGPHKAGTH
jgi:hypothetical protein